MNRSILWRIGPAIIAILLCAGCGDRGQPAGQPEGDSIQVDGFASIVVTNLDAFVVADDVLGGEFDYVCQSGVPRLEQVAGRRTLIGTGDRISRAEFVYDGIDGDAVDAFDLGRLDLTAGGRATRFLFDVTTANSRVTLTVRVFDSVANYHESAMLVIDQAGPLAIPFDEFEPVGDGARFDRVNQVTFAWELPPGSKVTIGPIRTGPSVHLDG